MVGDDTATVTYYSKVAIGQTLYSISETGILEWKVYSITFYPAFRSLQLIRYTNHIFQELISIIDTRIGIDFFLSRAEAEIELNLLALKGILYE